MQRFILFICLLWGAAQVAQAQTGGLKGRIKSALGDPLPLATIYVKNSQQGTAANVEAYYELRLPPGKYEVMFQYLSHKTLERTVEVGTEMQVLDITLEPQTYVLKEVEVKAGSEDPAYTIMRKAIAMSKVHKLQVDSYDARLYIKGTGRVLNIPWLVQKRLEKEGIVEGKAYLTENITDLHFEQPNKYVKKVVSIRSSNVEPKNASPMDYIEASFYDPQIGNIVSPLSPSAFAYYRFNLESVFRDQGYEVNKIRVTPRSRGDDVWEGHIYIIENKWCIHSLQLNTEKLGIKIGVQQTYSPIQDGVFMPTNHQINIGGSYLGFEAEGRYVASVSNYKLKVNPNYIPQIKLIDEKIEREKAAAVNQTNKTGEQDLEKALAEGKELTRKNLKKMLRESEKQQLAAERQRTKKGETPPSQLESNDSTAIDSLAYKRGLDEAFWKDARPIPLATFELKSYQERDSLIRVDSVKKATTVTDSLDGDAKPKKTSKGFRPWHLITGASYKTGKNSYFRIHEPLPELSYNTVEGFAANLRMSQTFNFKSGGRLRFVGLGRYALAREVFNGKGEVDLLYNRKRNGRFILDGGRFIQQISEEYPIPVFLNTITTLVFERNWMKLYERDYVRLRWNQQVNDALLLSGSLQVAQRRPLANQADYRTFDWEERTFTPNDPVNIEIPDTGFPTHQATILQLGVNYRPFIRYRVRNGRKSQVTEGTPEFKLRYRKGMGDTDFDFLSLGVKQSVRVGIRGKLGYAVSGGAFLNQRTLYFPDFKHFNGNRIFVQFADPVSSFRLLDYYRFSTGDRYLEGHAYMQFRKFLLTQFIYLRSFGWKENLFVNQLLTPSNNYTEVGYALDGILRLFRVEAIAAFENGQYLNWGIRVGITTTFGLLVNVD
jgi:hypothetical protein